MSSRTRSETALIRPFSNIASADTPLEEVRLIVGETEHEPGAVVLSEAELASAELTIRLPDAATVRAAVAQTVVPEVDAGLAVIGTAKSHRVSKVFVLDYLKPDSWPTELRLDRSAADLVLNDRQGFTITVAVLLRHNLTAEPLRPSMAGTWLARREFSISPERQDSSFSPEELSEEVRKQFNLRQGVQRFVWVDDWNDVEDLSEAVHVYVDPDTLHLLLASPTEPSAMQLQSELAVYAMEAVATTIARDIATDGAAASPDDLDSFPATKRFFENLARRLELALADLLELATNNPTKLRAHLEALVDLRAATTRALKER